MMAYAGCGWSISSVKLGVFAIIQIA